MTHEERTAIITRMSPAARAALQTRLNKLETRIAALEVRHAETQKIGQHMTKMRVQAYLRGKLGRKLK